MVTSVDATKGSNDDSQGEQQQSIEDTTNGTAAAEDGTDHGQPSKRQRQEEGGRDATVVTGTAEKSGDDDEKKKKKKIPKKVYQDDFRPGHGNALQAAVASIFGLELETVPNFIELFMGYEAGIEQFCRERGMASTKLRLSGDDSTAIDDAREGQLCVLRGKSPRGDHGHVVVARRTSQQGAESATGGFEMIHDPHPDESFLDASEAFGWCMFFDESVNDDVARENEANESG